MRTLTALRTGREIAASPGYCVCCDLPVESCGRRAQARIDADELDERRRIFALPAVIAARHAGRCGACGQSFDAGDPLRRDDGVWVSSCCIDPDERQPTL